MKKLTKTTKFAFRNNYDSKIWEFTGEQYNEDSHVNSGDERFTWAYLSEKQIEKAFTADDCVEPGYGYIMLKNNKVRQISF